MHKPLHIVSFDNPYPPSYGGTIEVYFKIKALHEIGYSIYLHCFVLEEPKPEFVPILENITSELYFYKYSYNPLKILSKLPFSVISRNHSSFITNILRHNAPILYESLKTTLSIDDIRIKSYRKYLRLHNIEQDYFSGIAKKEKSFLKRFLYKLEGSKFRSYENIITRFDNVFTLSQFENHYIKEKFGNAVFVPVFHGNTLIANLEGLGSYAFYHGDLSTSDNMAAAGFIIDIFKNMPDYNLIIASGSGEQQVKKKIGGANNIQFIKLGDFNHLIQLLNDAQVNIVWSFQRSGTKLKLVNTLFQSRHCIINKNVVDDPLVEKLCIIANTSYELAEAVHSYMAKLFTGVHERNSVLVTYFNDIDNAKLIDKLIYPENE